MFPPFGSFVYDPNLFICVLLIFDLSYLLFESFIDHNSFVIFFFMSFEIARILMNLVHFCVHSVGSLWLYFVGFFSY